MSVQLVKLPACPTWCDKSAQHHREDIEDLEGLTVHTGGRGRVRWSTSYDTVLGRVDTDQPGYVYPMVPVAGALTVAEARQLIIDLQAAVRAVEGVTVR